MSMQPNPVVTLDPGSWNDEWESEENENSPVSITHDRQGSELLQEAPPSFVNNERPRSGWLQDVFEGVRLTAVQSGQEILQASTVLTSGIIQRALPRPTNPNIQPVNVDCQRSDVEFSPTDTNSLATSPANASNDANGIKISPGHPTATIDPDSWNDEWESEEDEAAMSSNAAIRDNSEVLNSEFSERDQPQGSGWLQDVLEGVRITAMQSGQEIMQASSVMTSEVIQKALSKSHPSESNRFSVGNLADDARLEAPVFSINAVPGDDHLDKGSDAIDHTAWNDEWKVEEDYENTDTLPSNSSRYVPHSSPENQQGTKGWLQDVFQGVRTSAVQSGQEILQASGVLTSGVIQKAKNFVPFRDAPESSNADHADSNHTSILPSPSSPSHTLHEMFSNAVMVTASDRESPDHSSNLSISSDSSQAEVSEFLWNFPHLQTIENTQCDGSFDALFSLHGGTESEDHLEKLGRESIVRLQRMTHLLNSGASMIDNISIEVLHAGGHTAIKSSLVSNMRRLGAEIHDWHRNLLDHNDQLTDGNDIFLILDQVQAFTTRALAILAARSASLLLHSIQQWSADSKHPMKFARILRNFILTFNAEASSIAALSINFVRQRFSASTVHDDDIAILWADIEVDIFQAQIKIEDAVSNVIPMLQCMALPE